MTKENKQKLITHAPYIIIALLVTKLSYAWRYSAGTDLWQKILNLTDSLSVSFSNPLPSFYLNDILIGITAAILLRLFMYIKSKNAKKYRKGVEYGSARWGNKNDILPYTDPIFRRNIILTQTEYLMMNSRPKDPRLARNKNVLIIGGSGSGKTRFWLKPNLMQCHCSYIVTDPKGYNITRQMKIC